MEPPRLPKDDSAKRLRELTVRPPHPSPQPARSHMLALCQAVARVHIARAAIQAWQHAALA